MTGINVVTVARCVITVNAHDFTRVAAVAKVRLRTILTRARRTLLRLMLDDTGDALVEYCIVMATLTVLMMLAFRNAGSVANNSVGNSVNSMTNSSVVAP